MIKIIHQSLVIGKFGSVFEKLGLQRVLQMSFVLVRIVQKTRVSVHKIPAARTFIGRAETARHQ